MNVMQETKACECYHRLIKEELRKIQGNKRLHLVLMFLRHFNGEKR